MSEAGLRKLDQDLPRITVFSAEFMARKKQEKIQGEIDRLRPAVADPLAEVGIPARGLTTRLARRRRSILLDNIKTVKERTKRLVPNPIDSARSVHWIINEVALENGVLPSDIFGHRRNAYIVAVRHQAMARAYLAYHNKRSLPWLARHFERDHTTFLHAVQKSGHWQRREVT